MPKGSGRTDIDILKMMGRSRTLGTAAKGYFPNIAPIKFEGAGSRNPMSFKYYEPARMVMGRPMSKWLRFAVCSWHTWRGTGADIFGLEGSRKPAYPPARAPHPGLGSIRHARPPSRPQGHDTRLCAGARGHAL